MQTIKHNRRLFGATLAAAGLLAGGALAADTSGYLYGQVITDRSRPS